MLKRKMGVKASGRGWSGRAWREVVRVARRTGGRGEPGEEKENISRAFWGSVLGGKGGVWRYGGVYGEVNRGGMQLTAPVLRIGNCRLFDIFDIFVLIGHFRRWARGWRRGNICTGSLRIEYLL